MAGRLNFRQVEAFRAVFLTGSMTAAADMMGVTQPAVSRLIRDLEASLGLRLFERHGARIAPTSDAALLFQEVQRSFLGLERIAAAAAGITRLRQGTLRIAASVAASIGCLPPVLSSFREDWPGVAITVHTTSSPDILDLLTTQQFDVGVGVLPSHGPGLIIDAVRSLNAVCVLPAGHALAARRSVRIANLADTPLLTLPGNSLMQLRLQRVMEESGLEFQIVLETTFSATICSLVALGMGVAVIDPLTARLFDGRGIVVRPFEPPVPYELKVAQPAHRALSVHATAFVALLRQHLAPPDSASDRRRPDPRL